VSFSDANDQQVTVSASVKTAQGNPIPEGTVVFTFDNQFFRAPVDSNGVATTTLTVPAGTPAGSYQFVTTYADSANANGAVNYRSGTEAGYIRVAPAATVVRSTGVFVTGNGTQTVATLVAQVTAAGNTISDGRITFTLAGETVTVPAGSLLGATTVSAQYTDDSGNFASSNARQTLALSSAAKIFSVPIGPTADGWQLLQVSLFDRLTQLTFDSSGNPTSFAFGLAQGMLTYASDGVVQNVTIDGVSLFPQN
jgi:hypothetical protein